MDTQAQICDSEYENDHYKVFPDAKKGSDVNVQTIECINSNLNVNGLNIAQIPTDTTTANELPETGEAVNGEQNGNDLEDLNLHKNLLNICENANVNEQIQAPISVLDLTVANRGDNYVSILLGNGDGTFGPKTDFPVNNEPFSVAVGDFNGDSKLDVAVANRGDNDVSILLGNGDGTFGPKTDFVVGNSPISVAVGNFN